MLYISTVYCIRFIYLPLFINCFSQIKFLALAQGYPKNLYMAPCSKYLETPDLTHKIDFNHCAILGFSNHWQKRLIKKSLYIQKFNPSINIDKQSISRCLFNT